MKSLLGRPKGDGEGSVGALERLGLETLIQPLLKRLTPTSRSFNHCVKKKKSFLSINVVQVHLNENG